MNTDKPTTWEWRAGYDYATEKYKAEIDRLRANLNQCRAKHIVVGNEMQGEIDRLRTEIVQFKNALEMQQHTEMGLRAELEETMRGAKDAQDIAEHWTKEADRLRAENAALAEVERLARLIADCYWKQPIDVYGTELRKAVSELDKARNILAKTAKADAAAQNGDLFQDETLRTPDRP